MNFLKRLFGGTEPASASTAKARLRIVLEEERVGRSAPEFLPSLQRDLLEVVRRYYDLDEGMIRFGLERAGDTSVLNVTVDLDPACEKTSPGVMPRSVKPVKRRPRRLLGTGSTT